MAAREKKATLKTITHLDQFQPLEFGWIDRIESVLLVSRNREAVAVCAVQAVFRIVRQPRHVFGRLLHTDAESETTTHARFTQHLLLLTAPLSLHSGFVCAFSLRFALLGVQYRLRCIIFTECSARRREGNGPHGQQGTTATQQK